MWLAVRDTAVVAACGTAAGIPLAWLLARRLGAILFAVQPFDLPTTVAAIGLMALVVLIASIVPARRAALVDPVTSIRAE